MTTIKIVCGKGLKSRLIDLLKPISVRTTELLLPYSEFELIGVIDNSVELLKQQDYYECLTITVVDYNLI